MYLHENITSLFRLFLAIFLAKQTIFIKPPHNKRRNHWSENARHNSGKENDYPIHLKMI